MTLLICVPYFEVETHLFRSAVTTLLEQSYTGDYEVLIVNDGCVPTAESILGLKDPRLRFFTLKTNRGRYFIDGIASAVNPHHFYMPSDADDVSDRHRLEVLVRTQQESGADAVLHHQKVQMADGRVILETYPNMTAELPEDMQHFAHFSGLYRTEAVGKAGGFSGDFRVGYDTLFVNLVRMIGTIELIPQALYTRLHRERSLTNSRKTGFGSTHRRKAAKELNQLYGECRRAPDRIPEIIQSSMKRRTLRAMAVESARLKSEMGW